MTCTTLDSFDCLFSPQSLQLHEPKRSLTNERDAIGVYTKCGCPTLDFQLKSSRGPKGVGVTSAFAY